MSRERPEPSNTDLTPLMWRARRYWYEDGVPELFTGLLALALGAYTYARQVLPDSTAGDLAAGGLLLFVAVYSLSMRRLVMAVKRRWTMSRKDAAVLREAPPLPGWLWVAAGVGLAASIVRGAAELAPRTEVPTAVWAPLFGGLVLGAALLYVGHRLHIARFLVVGFLAAAWGSALVTIDVGGQHVVGLYLGGLGMLVVASGLYQLTVYLRRTRPGSHPQDG